LQQKVKAHKVDVKVMESLGDYGVPKVMKAKPTVPVEFNFSTGRQQQQQSATAAKIAGMATRKRSSTDMMQQQEKENAGNNNATPRVTATGAEKRQRMSIVESFFSKK
jgi:hypothetical protein